MSEYYKCYWCEQEFDRIPEHFVMHAGQWTCPEHVEDISKHLKPYILSKAEETLERAYDKNRV